MELPLFFFLIKPKLFFKKEKFFSSTYFFLSTFSFLKKKLEEKFHHKK